MLLSFLFNILEAKKRLSNNPQNNALNANRRQTQPAKPTQAAVCVSATVRLWKKALKNLSHTPIELSLPL
jgi:hypothetical protein